jgi:plasmid stabilization system protein ParE
MARKIVWSFEATDDLEAIADYIAKDSSFYAASFVQEVREASRSLDELSERGRIVPAFEPIIEYITTAFKIKDSPTAHPPLAL